MGLQDSRKQGQGVVQVLSHLHTPKANQREELVTQLNQVKLSRQKSAACEMGGKQLAFRNLRNIAMQTKAVGISLDRLIKPKDL